MTKNAAFAAALLTLATTGFAQDPLLTALRSARAGLEAELIAGDDAKAQTIWKDCLAAAAPGAEETRDCRIYADMFGASRRRPGNDNAMARKSFAAGVAAYRKGDKAAASARWHECLDRSSPATFVRDQCLAAIDLTPKKLDLTARDPEEPNTGTPAKDDPASSQAFLTGTLAYQMGDFKKARKSWETCAGKADPESAVSGDCRGALAKLDRDEAAAAAKAK